jgi:hypothetical protein
MEVWGLIGESHHRLHALACQLERQNDDDIVARQLKHDLAAELEAEKESIYRVLRSRSGFKERIARALDADAIMLASAEELDRASPRDRITIVDEIRRGLAEHMEHDAHIVPVAKKELRYHQWEHLKHEYESIKHGELKKLKGEPASSADAKWIHSMRALELEASKKGDAVTDFVRRIEQCERQNVYACQAAIDRSEEVTHRSLLGEIAEAHLRHLEALQEVLSGLDGRSQRGGGLSGLWARVYFSAFLGERPILKAVRANEQQLLRRYERMLHDGLASEAGRHILQSLVDEAHKHIDQLDSALGV